MTEPDDLNPPQRALWWLRAGGLTVGPDWARAHEICQTGNCGSPCRPLRRLRDLGGIGRGGDWAYAVPKVEDG